MAEQLTPDQELTFSKIITGEGYQILQQYKNRIAAYDQKLIDARLRGAPDANIKQAEAEILKMRQAYNAGREAHNTLLGHVQTAANSIRIGYTPQLAGMGVLPLAGYTVAQIIAAVLAVVAVGYLLDQFNNSIRTMQGKEPIVNDLLSKIMNPKTVEGIAGGITTIGIVAAVGFALYLGWQVMKKKELV